MRRFCDSNVSFACGVPDRIDWSNWGVDEEVFPPSLLASKCSSPEVLEFKLSSPNAIGAPLSNLVKVAVFEWFTSTKYWNS